MVGSKRIFCSADTYLVFKSKIWRYKVSLLKAQINKTKITLISGKSIEFLFFPSFFSVDLIGEFLQQNAVIDTKSFSFTGSENDMHLLLISLHAKDATGMLNTCSLFLSKNIILHWWVLTHLTSTFKHWIRNISHVRCSLVFLWS